MRVICPSCMQQVTVPDEMAGKATECPNCKAAFTAPTLIPEPTHAPPPEPAPPPRPEPPVTPPPPARTGPAALPPATPPAQSAGYTGGSTAGYTGGFRFALSLPALQITTAVALFLAFLLTFASWNGAYPGGIGVYTQSAWGAMAGGFTVDQAVGNQFDHLAGTRVDAEGTKHGNEMDEVIKQNIHSNWLLIPYLIPLLPLTLALAVFCAVLPYLKFQLPAQVEQLLPWRFPVLAVLCLVLLLLVAQQNLRGYSLERALRAVVEQPFESDRAAAEKTDDKRADEVRTVAIRTVKIRTGAALGELQLRRTTANRLAFLCQLVAAVAAGLMVPFSRRGERPPPRVVVLW